MEFSEFLKSKAIVSSSGEYAWKLDNIFEAVEELANANFAILGGEVWAMTKEHFDLPLLMRINQDEIVIGMIPGKNGESYIFNWHSDKERSEDWQSFVRRSKAETLDTLKNMNAEELVDETLKDSLFYNLTFVSEEEYKNL